MHKYRATYFFSLFDKGYSSADDILFDDILYVVFGPFVGEEVDSG